MTELVNAVAGGELGTQLDLISIAERDDLYQVQYEPEVAPNLCFRLIKDGPTIILYRSGAFSIAGADSIEEIESAFNQLTEFIENLDLRPDADYEIRYLVFKSNFGREIDLSELHKHLGSDAAEYEPEQFPQLKYDASEYGGVFMISRTGSIIYTGDTSTKKAKRAIDEVSNKIQTLFQGK